MNTNTKCKQWRMPFLLILFTLFFCWLFCGRYGVFGSKVDWISQHSVFPDYFRQQFYDTGDFFPEFAAGIGGGQNIYNFAYYGLYSPVFLLSYLLPFVKMSDYLIAASFTCLASAVVLLYFWLIKKRVLPDCQLSDCTVVFAVSTYDFSVLQPDYVCQLYAVSVYGSLGCGFFPGKRKTASLFIRCIFDDHDQLLLQYRRNSGPDFIRTAPILYAAGFAWKENPVS